jgi:predicted acylesterase/phospholipase RssA
MIPANRIEEASHAELSIGVSNLTCKKCQLITSGEMAPFVVASCAVPPIFCAQKIDGELYLDGGFTDESPFEQWIDDPEIQTIIIHQIIPENTGEWRFTKRSNFITCWGAMHEITSGELLKVRISKAEAAGKRVVIHQTVAPRPKLIASTRLAHANYQVAYETLLKSPISLS